MSIKRLVPLNTVSLTADPSTAIAGDIYYNSTSSQLRYFNGTSWIVLAGSVNSLVDAKSIYQDVRNQSGTSIAVATPVYVSGAIGASGKILISPASNASEATSSKTMAITTSAISNNSNGQIISEGLLEGIDTTGASDGDPVWLGVNGAKIYGLANKPAAPAHLVFLGIVVNGGSANAGSIFVKIQNGFELEEIHNVSISSLLNGNILAYDSTTSTWKNTNTLQSTASTVPLVIKGSESQTANLQEWQNSGGTSLAWFTSNGTLNVRYARATTNDSTVIPLIAKGAASQTANLQEWQDSTANPLAWVNFGGGIRGVSFRTATLNAVNAPLAILATSTSSPAAVIRALASQTANIQEWQDSAGTVLSNINNVGAANFVRAGIGGATPGTTPLFVTSPNASYIATIIRAASGQTANILEFQSSAGGLYSRFDSAGQYQGVYAVLSSDAVGTLPLKVKGASGQTANLTEWQNSAGTILLGVTAGGGIYNPSNTSAASFGMQSNTGTPQGAYFQVFGNNHASSTQRGGAEFVFSSENSGTGGFTAFQYQSGAWTPRFKVFNGGFTSINSTSATLGGGTVSSQLGVVINGATTVGSVIRGAASQTADLEQWQNSAGTVLSGINAAGQIHTGTTTSINGSITGVITSATKVSSTVASFGYTGTSLVQVGQRVTISSPSGDYDGTGFNGTWTVTAVTSNTFTVLGSGFVGWIVLPESEDGIFTLSAAGSFVANTALTTTVAVRGVASQTANLQEWQNTSGTVLAKVDASGNATAASFIKTSGTSSEFLKADGSVDSSTYLTTGTASSTYLPLTGGTVSSDLTVTGNFTVNGTTTNLNSTNLVVEDKNIIVADVATPTDTTADGAGITIKGATDKTLNWVQSTGSFTSSEPLIVSSNAANNITVFTAKDANNNKVIVNSDASNRTFITAQSNSSATGQAGAYFTADGFEESWFNINTRSNTSGQRYMRFGNLGNKFLVQRLNDAANVITSTPFTIENTSTTNSLYINSTGTIINGATALGQLTVYPASASTIGMVIRSAASQTANLQEWQNSAGTVLGSISSTGQLTLATAAISTLYTGGQASGGTLGYFTASTFSASAVNVVVRAIASQTADLTQWQDSAGTVLSSITYFGGARLYDLGIKGSPAGIGWAYFGNDNTSTKNVVVRAFASQTANLQEWQNSSGGVDTAVTSTGRLSVRTTLADAGLNVGTPSASTVGQIIRGAASQTANLQEWQNSAGTVLSRVDASGFFLIGGSGTTPGGQLGITTTSATARGIVIRGFASQTANLQEWQNDAGSVIASITPSGGITASSNITQSSSGRTFIGGAADYGAFLNIGIPTASRQGIVVRANASQTANLEEWQNNAGTVLALVDAYGRLGINTTSLPNSTGSYSMVSIYNHNTVNSNLIIKAYPSQTATLTEWHNSSGTALAKIDVLGNFTATSKSFDIPHPTKENMRLRYASLEGNEHGVYVRGTTKENVIELPEYWTKLVDESTITVSLTSVGKFQKVYVEKIEGNKIYIGGRVKEISYAVFGERKDIDKLIVEY